MRPRNDQDIPAASEDMDFLDALEADRHARLLDEIYIDAESLDAQTCPPDRRYFLAGKEAWVYEHDNICELVFVRHETE